MDDQETGEEFVIWSDLHGGYLRCEPDETHDAIWDRRIEVAKKYPTRTDVLAKIRELVYEAN